MSITEKQKEMTAQAHRDNFENPLMLTYAILPEPPKDTNAFLSPDRQPVYVDYANINWKALANNLQDSLSNLRLPKGIKVYVATDALDIWDVTHTIPHTATEVQDYEPVYEAYKCFDSMSFSDFRAGLITFPESANFHVRPPKKGLRTPVCGLFIAIRLDHFMQTLDYLEAVTYRLFNVRDHIATNPSVHKGVAIPEVIKDWILEESGVVTGDTMDIFRMHPVYRGAKKSRQQAPAP